MLKTGSYILEPAISSYSQLLGGSTLVPESLATKLAVQCWITIHGLLAYKTP